MAISTYSELQTAVADWLDREDLSAARVQDLIQSGEFRLYDDVKLRCMEGELLAQLDMGSAEVSYPSDAIGFKDAVYVYLGDTRSPIIARSEEWMKVYVTDTSTANLGKPEFFYLTADDKLHFDKYADQDYGITATYYKRLTLSSANTTNWILTNYPMAILYATLLEAQVMTENDPRTYEAMYEEQLRRLRRRDNRDRFGAGPKTFKQVDMGNANNAMGYQVQDNQPV